MALYRIAPLAVVFVASATFGQPAQAQGPRAPDSPAAIASAAAPQGTPSVQIHIPGSVTPGAPTPAPSASFISPSPYGLGRGRFAVGFGYQDQTVIGHGHDGVAAAAIGFGDPRHLAVDVGINLLSLGFYEPLLKRGSFNFKVHRLIPEQGLALAAGVRNAAPWGVGSDTPSQAYAVAGRQWRLGSGFSTLYLQGGAGYFFVSSGNSTFRQAAEAEARRFGPLHALGSVAIRVAEPATVFTEWTGGTLNLGISLLPFRKLGLVLTPTAVDITGRTNGHPRFMLGFGLPIGY